MTSSSFVAKRRRNHHPREKDKEVTTDCKCVPIGDNREGVSCETSKAGHFSNYCTLSVKCTRCNMSSAAHATCRVHQTQHAKFTRCTMPAAPDAIYQVHQKQYGKCTRWNMPSALDAICQVHQMQYAKCTRWNMPSQTENLYLAYFLKVHKHFFCFTINILRLRYQDHCVTRL